MSDVIKFKRGNKVNLPTLALGEPAMTIDTDELYVGTAHGNKNFTPGSSDTDANITMNDVITNNADINKHGFLLKGVAPATGINVPGIGAGETGYSMKALTPANVGLSNVTNNAQVKKIASSTDGKLMKWSGTNGDTPDVDKISSADAPIAVDRVNNSLPGATVTNQRIEDGWVYMQGNSTGKMTKAVVFPTAFDDIPMVQVTAIGGSKGTVPSNVGDFAVDISTYPTMAVKDLTVNGFTIVFYRSASFDNSSYYGAIWTAKGTKAR